MASGAPIYTFELGSGSGSGSGLPLEGGGFEVDPITSCPHLSHLASDDSLSELTLPLRCASCDGGKKGAGCAAGTSHGGEGIAESEKGGEGDGQEREEVWVCGTCQNVGCSRFVEGHALAHFETSAVGAGGAGDGTGSHPHPRSHPIAFSWSDLSCYCYLCDSYLNTFLLPALHPLFRRLYRAKFCEEPVLPKLHSLPSASSGAGEAAAGGAGKAE